jgi:geranylgeranylglycerol-phosphate geranylgeranyltransferase
MFCIQVSIGAVNDIVDVELDRVGKPAKPIPAGIVSFPVARAWATGAGGLGLALALPSGVPTVAVGAAGLGLGYLYDLWLSRTILAWLPLTLALPLVPVFAWLGATGGVPSALVGLVPIALLAGAALTVANGLVDVERDVLAGKPTIPVRLGRARAWVVHAGLFALAVALAFVLAPAAATSVGVGLDVAGGPGGIPDLVRAVGLPLGTVAIVAGAGLLTSASQGLRERGWELEGVGTAALGIGWLAGVAALSGGGAGT